MNLYQHKTENVLVKLLDDSAVNKYGKKLLWIRLENGNTISIWENQFKKEFKAA